MQPVDEPEVNFYLEQIPGLELSFKHYQPNGYGLEPFLLVRSLPPKHFHRAVDIGTGVGVIPLLIARFKLADEIWGLEVQEVPAQTARENVESNQLAGVITIQRADLRKLSGVLQRGKFDLVLANPPFYLPQSEDDDPAKSEVLGTLREFMYAASYLLKKQGLLAMIHTPIRLVEVLESLKAFGFEPKHLIAVHTDSAAQAHAVIIHAVLEGRPGLTWEPPYLLETML